MEQCSEFLAIILAVILDFRRIGFSDVTDIVKFELLDSDNIGKYILHSFHDNILRMIWKFDEKVL